MFSEMQPTYTITKKGYFHNSTKKIFFKFQNYCSLNLVIIGVYIGSSLLGPMQELNILQTNNFTKL